MNFTPFRPVAGRSLIALVGCAVTAGLIACAYDPGGQFPDFQRGAGFNDEVLEVYVKSKFSNIKVTRENRVKTLWFVRDNGEEVVESSLDLDRPHNLLVEYTRFMFLSYVFRPHPEKVLIVGLGGGSMVHFLNHYDRSLKVDVAEIDPQIITIAARNFGVSSGGRVNIMNVDAFAYLKNTEARYDVIYMDAFLKPSNDTDETGVPTRLKTVKFYKDVQKKLNPEGVVVFNLNPHQALAEDIKAIREAFAQTYVFELTQGGLVVVGSTSSAPMSPAAIATAARKLDIRFPGRYSFRRMAEKLKSE
jgi:spermidine synthase